MGLSLRGVCYRGAVSDTVRQCGVHSVIANFKRALFHFYVRWSSPRWLLPLSAIADPTTTVLPRTCRSGTQCTDRPCGPSATRTASPSAVAACRYTSSLNRGSIAANVPWVAEGSSPAAAAAMAACEARELQHVLVRT